MSRIGGSEALCEQHDVSAFSCGHASLDHWWRVRALSNQEKGFTAVVVVHVGSRIVGLYGPAPTVVLPAQLPRSLSTGQPPDPVPCLLLGQLATDTLWAGKGIEQGWLNMPCSAAWLPPDWLAGGLWWCMR